MVEMAQFDTGLPTFLLQTISLRPKNPSCSVLAVPQEFYDSPFKSALLRIRR